MKLSGELPPALVLSLDFELHWGVRARHAAAGPYAPNLLGARAVIPRLLDLFREFDVAATWATVGFLFARSRDELQRFSPTVRPAYPDRNLSSYDEPVGADEHEDPLHFASSLIEQIRRTPRQEIGTHTFSHYFCNEPGHTAAALRADLAAARAIAAAHGIELRSIVFPRNQYNSELDGVLRESGLVAYRGNPLSWMWRFAGVDESATPAKRLARLADAYVGLPGADATIGWNEILQPSGLADVRASAFVRPYLPRLRHLEPLRLRRIRSLLRSAARRRRIVHLWWHPHNFGADQERNLDFLRAVFEEFARCRESLGMRSLTMGEVHDLAGSRGALPALARSSARRAKVSSSGVK